jgi:hypothetical protein
MKPEEQRIAFLQYLGWTELNRDSKLGNFRALRGTSPDGKTNQVAPNPLLDLNVIHEVEKQFSLPILVKYSANLKSILVRDRLDTGTGEEVWASCINAKPIQKLEAFLKTVDLWKE